MSGCQKTMSGAAGVKGWGIPYGSAVKILPSMQEPQETWVGSLGWDILFLTLEENFQLFSVDYVSHDLVIYGLYYVEVYFPYPLC